MSENIIEKKISELKAGEVLAENILNKEELKFGTPLDASKIQLLIKLGIEKVKVFVSNVKPSLSTKDDISQMIRKNIEIAYLKSIISKTPQVSIKEEDYAPEIRKKAKEIIEHIKQSKEEIYKIENLPKKALKGINKKIEEHLQDVYILLTRLIQEKIFKIEDFAKIVESLIEDTGPKRDSTFLLLHLKRKSPNIIIGHSINVALLSLAIAIELSKIMESKLEDPNVKGDFKKLDICNSKIFTKNEMIKLGIAALLHDIGLIESFPDITSEKKFDLREKSKIELHPNRAYHFLTELGVDYDIRKAVFQHHERIDGSGYPDGIEARFFTKYGLILSFADYFDLLTSNNPFYKRMHPHQAIMHILTKDRTKFDQDVIFAYCQAASIYPIGSWILCSNNKIGVVMRTNKNNLKRPKVKFVFSSDLKELAKKEFVDLTKTDLKIVELIDIEHLEKFNNNISQFMFDEREFERINVKIEAEAIPVATELKRKILLENLSAGGVRFYSKEKFTIGDEIFLNFSFEGIPFNAKGLILWEDGEAAGENRYGVRFLEIPNDKKENLIKLVERYITK